MVVTRVCGGEAEDEGKDLHGENDEGEPLRMQYAKARWRRDSVAEWNYLRKDALIWIYDKKRRRRAKIIELDPKPGTMNDDGTVAEFQSMKYSPSIGACASARAGRRVAQSVGRAREVGGGGEILSRRLHRRRRAIQARGMESAADPPRQAGPARDQLLRLQAQHARGEPASEIQTRIRGPVLDG